MIETTTNRANSTEPQVPASLVTLLRDFFYLKLKIQKAIFLAWLNVDESLSLFLLKLQTNFY